MATNRKTSQGASPRKRGAKTSPRPDLGDAQLGAALEAFSILVATYRRGDSLLRDREAEVLLLDVCTRLINLMDRRQTSLERREYAACRVRLVEYYRRAPQRFESEAERAEARRLLVKAMGPFGRSITPAFQKKWAMSKNDIHDLRKRKKDRPAYAKSIADLAVAVVGEAANVAGRAVWEWKAFGDEDVPLLEFFGVEVDMAAAGASLLQLLPKIPGVDLGPTIRQLAARSRLPVEEWPHPALKAPSAKAKK